MHSYAKKTILGALLAAGVAAIFVMGGIRGWLRAYAQTGEDAPPVITNVKVVYASATSTVVTWTTDKKSDSMLNYALDQTYGTVRDPTASTTAHVLVIPNLLPGTSYFFRVISSDASGNQSLSADYTFSTTGLPAISLKPTETPKPSTPPPAYSGTGQQVHVPEDVLKIIDAITDPDLLAKIAEQINKVAERIVKPPLIIGNPREEMGADWALISWETDKESNSLVEFSVQNEYDASRENPYAARQGNTEDLALAHVVRIVGLQPATTYHYRVSSKEEIGLAGKSADKTFRTKSILPEIKNVTLKKVEETSATIAWLTNIPTSAVVEYTNLSTKETRSAGNPALLTAHAVQLIGLALKTSYSAVVTGENEVGDKVGSRPVTFTTTKDEFPPAISRVTNESTLYPGEDTKIQTIISWETDELATCHISYHEGVAGSTKSESGMTEANPATKHVQVVTAFQPATIYMFRIACADGVGNESRSEDFVLFTPQKEKSIIDIILENFQGTFGWVKNIGK